MEKRLIFNFHAIIVGNFKFVDLFMLFDITYNLINCIHQHTHTHILFKKSKIYFETFKTLLHVSIARSSSGSIYCFLLKL
jgi:hypothetical protein